MALLEPCVLQYNQDRALEDQIFIRQDTAQLTYLETWVNTRIARICIECFRTKQIKRESRFQAKGFSKRTACKAHSCEDTVSAKCTLPAPVPPIPKHDFRRLKQIVRDGCFRRFLLFNIEKGEEGTEVRLNEQNLAIARCKSTGEVTRLCCACLCFDETVRRAKSDDEFLCHDHSGETPWPQRHSSKADLVRRLVQTASNLPEVSYIMIFGGPVARPMSIYPRKGKYFMWRRRWRKICRRLSQARAPSRMDFFATPFLCADSGELRGWDGEQARRLCETCYSKQNNIRGCFAASRQCITHLRRISKV